MNAKYMAVFAAVIMFAGCASVLAYADDADVDAATNKTVYVINGQEASLAINTTETASGGYDTNATWKYNDAEISKDSTRKTSLSTTSVSNMAEVYWTGEDGAYELHFKGNAVGTGTFTFIYTVGIIVDSEDDPLTDTIDYSITVTVLPSTFKASVTGTFSNYTPVSSEGIDVALSEGIDDTNEEQYYFYALGLPDGLALNNDGKIYGTPNVSDTEFTGDSKEYPVTIIATHKVSNLAIKTQFTITLFKNVDSFTYAVSGEGVVKVTDEIYKVFSGTTITVTTTVNGTPNNVEEFYLVVNDESEITGDSLKVNGTDGVYTIEDTAGTGEYSVVMNNGTEQESFALVIVEPVEDVVADIGFTPGVGNTNPKLN